MQWDPPLVWRVMTSLSAFDGFGGPRDFSHSLGLTPLASAVSGQLLPLGVIIRTPLLCGQSTGDFAESPGKRSRPGLFANLLGGCPIENDWPHGVGDFFLAFLVGDFFLSLG